MACAAMTCEMQNNETMQLRLHSKRLAIGAHNEQRRRHSGAPMLRKYAATSFLFRLMACLRAVVPCMQRNETSALRSTRKRVVSRRPYQAEFINAVQPLIKEIRTIESNYSRSRDLKGCSTRIAARSRLRRSRRENE